MTTVMFNITEEPLDEKIICYYTDVINDEYVIKAVVERKYRHPQVPEYGRVTNTEIKEIDRIKIRSYKEGPARLLQNVNQTIEELYKER